MYSPGLLDHFEHPRNAGALQSPHATAQVENPVCGDVLKLSANVSDGRIAEIRFLAKGCVPAMACASAVTELVKGKTLNQASALKPEELEKWVGGVPQASTHASHLAIDTLAALIKKLRELPQSIR